MFITSREKTIIELLIKTGGRHTSLSIATYLQVSVRTIHRDLKNVEKILTDFHLKLVQQADHRLEIAGSDEAVFKLAQVLSQSKPLDLSTKERKLLLLLQLLQAREPLKAGVLSMDLGVSTTTVQSYLADLADWLKDFNVDLRRKRGVGMSLSGYERAKRKALGNFFLCYFNEELIEAMFSLSHPDNLQNHLLLHYFKPIYLIEIDRAIKENITLLDAELADSDYVGFMVHVGIALQRFEQGFALTAADGGSHAWRTNEEAHPFIEKIAGVFTRRLSIVLPEREKYFLADILKGSRLQHAESVYYDRPITGKDVKKLIQRISNQIHVDLTGDFSLFQGLMAHLEPSLFRIRKAIPSANPLTKQVEEQFPALFAITADCLRQVFTGIRFPEDEVAYVVLHFGSALEQRRQKIKLRALVVCPTGIGASKMLAMRLRKEMPELSSVTVTSIGNMEKLDAGKFDLMLATVHLPKQPLPCVVVNPLLTKENIAEIRAIVGKLIDRKKSVPQAFVPPDRLYRPRSAKGRSLSRLMEDLDRVQAGIREILATFAVVPVNHAKNKEQVIRTMAEQAAQRQLADNPESVYQRLLAREKMAGLGIPNTNMALFHCRDGSIKKIAFLIGHANHHFGLRGMDGKPVDVSNFLILLAPEPLDIARQEVISMISSSLVEDQESLLVFASANDKLIRKKLADIFYRLLREKLIKE
ncbi:MAG: BglG family transcription antiterminator [Sporolactobacillus sp.]|jgi:mannitol operon transcriptional antiterminator|nr:BglG family transcription antiterminator [Sporolactobacillus sp.]